MHGKLTNLFRISIAFFTALIKFFASIVLTLIIKNQRSLIQKFFFPVTDEIGLQTVLRSNFIDGFLSFNDFKNNLGFKFSRKKYVLHGT